MGGADCAGRGLTVGRALRYLLLLLLLSLAAAWLADHPGRLTLTWED